MVLEVRDNHALADVQQLPDVGQNEHTEERQRSRACQRESEYCLRFVVRHHITPNRLPSMRAGRFGSGLKRADVRLGSGGAEAEALVKRSQGVPWLHERAGL